MRQIAAILGLAAILLVPVYAYAQTADRISVLDSFGTYDRGEPMFVYGQVASLEADSFLIMQIINPQGDLCQIQQLTPLPNGDFITDVIPLKGRICGLAGEYEVKLFYGDNSKSATFNVSGDIFSGSGSEQKVSLARSLVSDHSLLISELFDIPAPSNQTSNNISELESAYVSLWEEYFAADLLFEVDPMIRPAVASSLDSVQQLLDEDKISFEIGESINRTIFSAIFYYEIGDRTKAIDLMADAFVDIRNVNPVKTAERTPTFDDLEETLLNLMQKSDTVMSKFVKDEIGFIFARGTAPVYSEEIGKLIDVLSESRYLDVVSRKQSDLYRLINNEWNTIKPTLQATESIDELIGSSARVSDLYQAALLLRELDGVERFISSDSEENGALANLIMPDWRALESDLTLATSVGAILDASSEISEMAQIIDISSRISKSVEISRTSGANPSLVSDWESLLERVTAADSTDEILEIVSEFNQSMEELREKRNPLTVLEFEYNSMKKKAELQADYHNLYLIDNALQIIETAKQMESGNPSTTRIDRIEVLLTWASEKAPAIRADLDSYNKDASKVRASDILQRAQSLENLVELSLTKNRFLPNFVEFTDTFHERIGNVRDLVIKNDLDQADGLVRELFDEWALVSEAYAKDPFGSDVGYSADELKRIEFRKKLDRLSDMVSTFYNSGFSEHVSEYHQLRGEADRLIQIANFVDAESKVSEIAEYLSEHLVLTSPRIFYDISFDAERDIWIIDGHTEKSRFDQREKILVTVYDMDGNTHSSLKFTDTKQGKFYTQWNAPAEPGLYVALLEYQNAQATQIAYVAEEFDYEPSPSDLNMVDLAREFAELESFAKEFGGKNFEDNPRFASVIKEIETGFTNRDSKGVNDNLDEFRTIIERYLPMRNPAAPIEASYDSDTLVITGRVLKTVQFSEDMFIDVYNQQGERIEEIALRDDPSGLFNEVLSKPFEPGVYVVQLQYHDLIVTDFFKVP